MLLDVQPDAPTPIYEQIVTQVIFAVASGAVPAGELVPSVRELAARLLVNPNTVARAFQELERRGVLAAQRGRGMEVTADGPRLCRTERQAIIRQRVGDAVAEALGAGLTVDEIRKLVESDLKQGPNGRSRGGKAT
jgi:GntR family transcriptional regulator